MSGKDGRLLPKLPRPDADDADVRRFLGCAVIVVAIASAGASALADAPEPVPGVALRDAGVWHVEVFAAIVALLYLVIAGIALSFHGWLPTKIDTPVGGGRVAPVT